MKSFKIIGLIITLLLVNLSFVFAADPIASYSFDVDASDATGSFNGTLEGDAAIVDDADRGKVLELTETGYVNIPPAVTATMENFSFTAWVLFAGKNAWAGIMGMGNGTGKDAPYWDFHIRSDGTLSFYSTGDEAAVWPGNGDCMVCVGDNMLDFPGWVHLAFTFTKGTGGAIYTNGVLQDIEVWNAGYPNAGDVSPKDVAWEHVYIGKDYFNQGVLTYTKIDEFKFFDVALTAEEVTAIYTGASSIEEEEVSLISSYQLAQNYPNPFNPETTIKFDIPENSKVKLSIFNINGQEIAVLVDDFRNAGTYSTSFNGSNLTSGIYFYRLEANGHKTTKRMVLLK